MQALRVLRERLIRVTYSWPTCLDCQSLIRHANAGRATQRSSVIAVLAATRHAIAHGGCLGGPVYLPDMTPADVPAAGH